MRLIFCFLFISILYSSEIKMGLKVFHLYDKNRNRLVEMDVWYPTSSHEKITPCQIDLWRHYPEVKDGKIADKRRKYPLIIMSHGVGGERRDRTWLANILVSQGYIVASVDHFGDNWGYYHPDLFLRAWDRPLDITFSLDYLLDQSFFSKYIDDNSIGFASYSFGGMTGLWLAGGLAVEFETILKRYQFFTREFPDDVVENLEYEKCLLSYLDPRIKAYFLMAPPSWGFNDETIKHIDKPFFIVGAENDDVLPPYNHACYLADHIPNSECHIINNKSSHYVFLNESTELGRKIIDSRFYDDNQEVDRYKVHQEIGKMAVDFFQKHLKRKED